jgi:outer membrane protein
MNQLQKCMACVLTLLALLPLSLAAQQITKFGVVDTSRVYNAYFKDTAPIRSYEQKRAEFQSEINKQTEELKKLQTQKIDAERRGKPPDAQRIDTEIAQKTEALTQYTNAKNAELESLKNNLQRSDAFYSKLYATLAKIAESEGYSMILSLQQVSGILWYSPTVDVTDTVIRALGI